jgi:glycosyltransferase involved in cell wall biosynthesis
MQIAAVVPAYNESTRIGNVLKVLHSIDLLSEIIVVDDGSTDNTLAEVPRNNGVRALRFEQNRGKGAALFAGARLSQSDILLFLDADLVGLTTGHVEALLAPVMNREADMSVASFRGGRWRTDWAQKLVPCISGQRVLHKEFFFSLANLDHSRYSIETALTLEARLRGARVKKVYWDGVTHVMKEEKLGWTRGMWERAKMYWEIGSYVLDFSRDGHSVSPPSPSHDSQTEKACEE